MTKTEFKVGDKLVVIGDSKNNPAGQHCYDVGTVVTVVSQSRARSVEPGTVCVISAPGGVLGDLVQQLLPQDLRRVEPMGAEEKKYTLEEILESGEGTYWTDESYPPYNFTVARAAKGNGTVTINLNEGGCGVTARAVMQAILDNKTFTK